MMNKKLPFKILTAYDLRAKGIMYDDVKPLVLIHINIGESNYM